MKLTDNELLFYAGEPQRKRPYIEVPEWNTSIDVLFYVQYFRKDLCEKYKMFIDETHFDRNLDLSDTPITSLGNLKSVEGFLDLRGTPITSLGDLESVGGFLDLRGTPQKPNNAVASLGNLRYVGGNLWLEGTKVTKLPEGLKVGGKIFR